MGLLGVIGMSDSIVYLVSTALVILALLIRGHGTGNSIKARDISDTIFINGNNSGSVVKHSSSGASEAKSKEPKNRVSLAIGLAGLFFAAGNFIINFLKY